MTWFGCKTEHRAFGILENKMIPKLAAKMMVIHPTISHAVTTCAGEWCHHRIYFVHPAWIMYMPKSDAEKVTVKGSHGDSSLQRESDSFRVKWTASWQGTAVPCKPRGPKHQKISHTKSYTQITHNWNHIIKNKKTQEIFWHDYTWVERHGLWIQVKEMQLHITLWPITAM